jgi:hypothetical protein
MANKDSPTDRADLRRLLGVTSRTLLLEWTLVLLRTELRPDDRSDPSAPAGAVEFRLSDRDGDASPPAGTSNGHTLSATKFMSCQHAVQMWYLRPFSRHFGQ